MTARDIPPNDSSDKDPRAISAISASRTSEGWTLHDGGCTTPESLSDFGGKVAGETSNDSGAWIWVVLMLGLGYWYFSSAEKTDEIESASYSMPQAATPAQPPRVITPPTPAPTPPVPETHNYKFVEDGIYGYVSAVSEEDRKRGIAVGDVFLVRYLGKTESNYRIQMLNDAGQVTSYNECPRQCAAIRSYVGGALTRIPYDPGSIIGAAFEDAFLGKLRAKPLKMPKPAPIEPAIEDVVQPSPTANGVGQPYEG